MPDEVATQDADRQRAVERGGGAFAGDIAESDGEPAFSVGKKIVKIAAKLARGAIPGGEIEAGDFARAGGKKLALNFARCIEIVLETALVDARIFIKARVFQSDGDIGTKRRERALMLLRKSVRQDRKSVV